MYDTMGEGEAISEAVPDGGGWKALWACVFWTFSCINTVLFPPPLSSCPSSLSHLYRPYDHQLWPQRDIALRSPHSPGHLTSSPLTRSPKSWGRTLKQDFPPPRPSRISISMVKIGLKVVKEFRYGRYSSNRSAMPCKCLCV